MGYYFIDVPSVIPTRRLKTAYPGFSGVISGHRHYSPELGRWVNRDPIEEAGGLNVYGFVWNEPSSRYDAVGYAGNDPQGNLTFGCCKGKVFFPETQCCKDGEIHMLNEDTAVEECTLLWPPHGYLKTRDRACGFYLQRHYDRYYGGGRQASGSIGGVIGGLAPGAGRVVCEQTGGTCASVTINPCKIGKECFENCVYSRLKPAGDSGWYWSVIGRNCFVWNRSVISDCKEICAGK